MFQLHDLRESKVWQEAHQEGIEEGIQKGIEEGIQKGIDEGKTIAKEEMVQKCVAKGMSVKQIAELMEIPVAEVRRLAKGHARWRTDAKRMFRETGRTQDGQISLV